MKKVLVIGSGIVGQVVAEELANDHIDLFLLDKIHPRNVVETLRDIGGGKSVWINGSRVSGYPGGRLVWGENSSFVLARDDEGFDEPFRSKLNLISKRLEKYGFPRFELKILDPSSEVDSFKVKTNSKFDSTEWLQRITRNGKIGFIEGHATKLKLNKDSGIMVEYLNPERELMFLEVDFVILCSGSIGTQELLTNSHLVEESMDGVFDHPSFPLATAHFKKIHLGSKLLFGWNRIRRLNTKTCLTYRDDENQLLWTVRFFPSGVISIRSSLGLLKRSVESKSIWLFMRSCFLVMISFLTGRIIYSGINIFGTLDFLHKPDTMQPTTFSKSERIDSMHYLQSDFQVPLKLEVAVRRELEKIVCREEPEIDLKSTIQIDDFESSSHQMGTISFPNSSRSCFFEFRPNLFVAGSASFDVSVPGHPTMMAAATGIYVVDHIRQKLK